MDKRITVFYKPAPDGSPDRFVTDRPVTVFWRGAPKKYLRLVKRPVSLPHGLVWSDNVNGRVSLALAPGFFFDVSVAPSARRALPGAAAHDWLYANAEALAKAWRCPARQVLALADHWFLALMRGEEFALARAYFLGVSLFGHAYHALGRWLRARRSKGEKT